ADGGTQNLDAVVVGAENRVARDDEALGIERDHGRHGDVGEDIARDVAGDLLEPDAAAAGARDLAIEDAHVASAETVDEAAARRERNAAAVEGDAGEADRAGAFAEDHRRTTGEDKFRRTAHAHELRAVLQPQQPGAVHAGRECQWYLRARSVVDG